MLFTHLLILVILSKHASIGQSYYCCCLVAKSRPTVTPWTVAHQTPLSLGFSRQEYWSRLPFPSLGDLPDSGITPRSPALQADSLSLIHQGSPLYIVLFPNSLHFNMSQVGIKRKKEKGPLSRVLSVRLETHALTSGLFVNHSSIY